MKSRAPLLRVLLVVVACVGLAGALPATAAARGNARPGRVRFEMAETKFNLGRFEEAAVDYQAAYEAEPLPAFLFNIGQCYRNLGDHARAQSYFRRYVQLDPRSPNRADAERLIAEMDRLADNPKDAQPSAARPPPPPSLPTSASAASADDAHAFAPSVAHTGDTDPAPPPLYRRPWFWVGGAAVAAAAIAAGVVLVRDDRQPSLQAIDAR